MAFKETLIGIALIAICWLLYVLYIGYNRFCEEDSKRGRRAKKIGKIASGAFLIYIALCSILGFVIGLIAIFT